MGKSDIIIFKEYANVLSLAAAAFKDVAFLGFSQENEFTNSIIAETKTFYDLSLGNWDINTSWSLNQKYDLIVCTRCAYFSKNPDDFILRIKDHLVSGGHALIDWGLGDHWRFSKYKIGWIRDGEHEFAYKKDNFLYSCFWNDYVKNHEDTIKFWNYVISNPSFGYTLTDDIDQIIKKEIPKTICYKTKFLSIKCLWPESPQLYIITLVSES
jgi:SAM-dependent methyltransferase